MAPLSLYTSSLAEVVHTDISATDRSSEQMITPTYTIEQSDEFIILYISCPYIRTQEVEFCVEGTEFKFFAKPYFLKLSFEHALIEDGREKATYDVDQGKMIVTLPKAVEKQHFAHLNLLLNQRESPAISLAARKPLIEEIGAPIHSDFLTTQELGELRDRVELAEKNEEEYDWSWEPASTFRANDALVMSESLDGPLTISYGFNQQYSNVFKHISSYELQEMTDVSSPETMTPEQRRLQREDSEMADFDEDHYIADFLESDFLVDIQSFVPWYYSLNEATLSLSEEEKLQLGSLANREYLIDSPKSIYLGLIDLLFAYCYNHRTTLGENTVESCWTIRKSSAMLSWFDVFHYMKDVVVASLRRSLCYPLYRHFKLSMMVLRDVHQILSLGKIAIVKAILESSRICAEDHNGQHLKRIFFDDYAVWLKSASNRAILSLASEFEKHLSENELKTSLGLDLCAFEKLAVEMAEEENDVTTHHMETFEEVVDDNA